MAILGYLSSNPAKKTLKADSEFPYDLTTKLTDIACAPVGLSLDTLAYRFLYDYQIT